jgi:hypothetical protein
MGEIMLVKKFRCYELEDNNSIRTIKDIVADSSCSLIGDWLLESFDTIEEAEKALDKFIEEHLSIAYKGFTILPVYVHSVKE